VKIFLTAIIVILIAPASSHGWIIEEPVDYPKLLREADFVGVVGVFKVIETGRKKVLHKDGVAFRELRLELEVLSLLKGEGGKIACVIHREPTEAELLADGVSEDEVMKILLDLGTDEGMHLFPARVAQGDQLLVYLRSTESTHVPVTGHLNSSRSLFRLEPSNMVNTPHRNQNAEIVPAAPDLKSEP